MRPVPNEAGVLYSTGLGCQGREVRRMRIEPGSDREREKDGETPVVRSEGQPISEDIHRHCSRRPRSREPRTLEELKEGVRRHVKGRPLGKV